VTSFDVLESSVQDSRPIEVYTFGLGTTSFTYTSAEDPITLGTTVHEPIAIARSGVSQGAGDNVNTLTVTVPADNPFASKYVDLVPGQRATLTIVRLQRNESPTFNTQVVIYKGSVLSVRFPNDGEVAEVAVRSLENAGNRRIPRYTFMAQCNHLLYGPGCDVSTVAFNDVGTVTAVSGSVITVSGGVGSRPANFFRGGFVKPSAESDFRLIVAHSGANLTLLLPFATSILGASVQAFAGCDHRFRGDCATKFDNIHSYGGFPYVPRKNPFVSGLVTI